MSTEENKAIVRRYFEVFNSPDLAGAEEFLNPDFLDHHLPPGSPTGLAGLKQMMADFKKSFPDYNVTIEDMIAEGDKVVTRGTYRATHKGMFRGVPATGKQITTTGINIWRIVDGKITEHWAESDSLGMLQQVGVIPMLD
jgi:steroid delta-isomerase-like uncharacterized protein